ncbi:MAG: hypothetical protein HRU41_30455 [Saprospiraceae bacterium]|nr:hypothetical protein [Saprospiraceae bacterium]
MGNNRWWLRISGLFGVLGGLILFAGDMLFYFNGNSTDLVGNMSQASDFRIKASAVTALLASWCYVLGLPHLNFAFGPAKPVIRKGIVLGFGSIFIAYGVIHGAFVAIATSAKLATAHQLDVAQSIVLAREANDVLRAFVYPIFGVVSLFFIAQVWKRKTLYPRWILIFYPLTTLILFELVISKLLSGAAWTMVMGGHFNLILVLFFAASTVVLWGEEAEHL